ncbi:MAG TPA: response regulator [Phycisphaerae bacterium]|nr:response regulator [Phycisphaerae bacterium]HRW52538.1 response regulator [Phycisphaerae bacterium]
MMFVNRRVYLVDSDAESRSALSRVFNTVHLHSVECESAEDFLKAYDPQIDSCVVLEVRLPGMTGLALQKRLNQKEVPIPILFVTGHADVATAVEAIRNGADDFLQKPVEPQRLIDRIHLAFERNQATRERAMCREECKRTLAQLTRRENQVLMELVQGRSNRVIAEALGIRERTVEAHRAGIMRKLKAHSIVDVVRCAFAAGVDDPARPVNDSKSAPVESYSENTVMRSFA